MKKKVCIIGNNNDGNPVFDGGRIKLRLYAKKLQEHGDEVEIIDLHRWLWRLFITINRIKKAIRTNDVILLMAGPNGCRRLIPLLNRWNQKYHKRIVYCLLGVGTADALVKNLNPEQVSQFLQCEDFFNIQDEKMKKELQKLDLIVPQNPTLVHFYRTYYQLSNVELLLNFRDVEITPRIDNVHQGFHLIYASRVTASKGIMDLLQVVNFLIKEHQYDIYLDIYGEMQLGEEQKAIFEQSLSDRIVYQGVAEQSQMISLLQKYDLFCLPTKYHGEGTPGILIESLIAGTPILVSAYSQVHDFVEENKTAILFELNSLPSLQEKMVFCYQNPKVLHQMSQECQKSAQKYLFTGENQTKFYLYIRGEE